MRSRKKLFSILLPATIFFILFYLLVKLYQGNENDIENAAHKEVDGRYADPEMNISDSLK
jgi:hypothetical protein